VSGDVAFAGKPEEYEIAANWIDSIQEAVACPREGIMVTPGNHDVDRDQVPDGGELATLQDRIRKGSSLAERDSALAQVLRHPTDGAQLFASMSAYMQFAERYGCSVSPTLPYWERAFKLRDGSILKFRGLTTTLLSGPHDDDQTHKMFYGSAQRIILRDDKVRHVVVGHHPPSWCFEGDDAERIWSARTVLQAFGHKHDQWIIPIGNSVRLIAGAFHPDRREPQWLPRYSAIAFTAQDQSHVALRIYPRRWSFEELSFIPDFNSQGVDYREYVLTVDA